MPTPTSTWTSRIPRRVRPPDRSRLGRTASVDGYQGIRARDGPGSLAHAGTDLELLATPGSSDLVAPGRPSMLRRIHHERDQGRSGAVGASQPAQLRADVGTGAALAAIAFDGLVERGQDTDDRLAVGFPPPALARLDPLRRGGVSALSVASTARRDLVLDPTGAALEAGDDMLCGGGHQPHLELAAAPHTTRPIALEDQGQAFASIGTACHGRIVT